MFVVRRLCAIGLLIANLSGCSILAGWANPSTPIGTSNHPTIKPNVIPLTPQLVKEDESAHYIYRVAPADELDIVLWNYNQGVGSLNGIGLAANQAIDANSKQFFQNANGYLVNQDGYIFYPLIGSIKVSDLSVDEVRLLIEEKLSTYLKNPQVLVRVSNFRGHRAYVLGEVVKPGFVPINDRPLTITGALSIMGSIDKRSADTGHIYVIRGNPAAPNIYWLNARKPTALLLADHFQIYPGDVLYVSSAPITRWNRFLEQILPTLQLITYTQVLNHV